MTYFRHRILGVGAGGEQWITTLHTEGAGPLSTANTAFASFASYLFTSDLAALWNTHTGMTGVVTDELDPVTGHNVAQASTDVSHLGTATDSPGSPRSCVVVTLKTDLATRRGRGRMFLPAPTAASITAFGALSDGARAAFVGIIGPALTTLAGWSQPVIFHRPGAIAHPLFDLTGTPITSISVGNTLGTQKRRTNQTANLKLSAAL